MHFWESSPVQLTSIVILPRFNLINDRMIIMDIKF